MNIIKRELKANRKALIIWSLSMVFLIYVGMMKYAGMLEAGDGINELMDSMPEVFKVMFGLGKFDLTQVGGYYGVFFMYFVLLGSVHASMLGATILSKEERDKTADFLLVKPVERTTIITSKLIASLINIVVLNLVTLVTSIVVVGTYNKGESINGEIVKLMMALFGMQIIYFCIGLFVSSLVRNTKKATGITSGILLFGYILSVGINLYKDIENLKYITPFKYYEAKNIMYGGKVDGVYLFLTAVIVIGGIAMTYINYQKRDIHV